MLPQPPSRSPSHGHPLTPGATLSKERRDGLTPDHVIEMLKHGNERFLSGRLIERDYGHQRRASAAAQFPAAAVLGCVDSRTPAEIIFDIGIGDAFSIRVAGNVVNDDVLGSLEFACAIAGAKVVLVLGHTACGAIKGAIDDVDMGKLTGLLARIKPAIAATEFSGERSGENPAFIDAVSRTHVRLGIEHVRHQSPILADLERAGQIRIAGALYDLAEGVVEFL